MAMLGSMLGSILCSSEQVLVAGNLPSSGYKVEIIPLSCFGGRSKF